MNSVEYAAFQILLMNGNRKKLCENYLTCIWIAAASRSRKSFLASLAALVLAIISSLEAMIFHCWHLTRFSQKIKDYRSFVSWFIFCDFLCVQCSLLVCFSRREIFGNVLLTVKSVYWKDKTDWLPVYRKQNFAKFLTSLPAFSKQLD